MSRGERAWEKTRGETEVWAHSTSSVSDPVNPKLGAEAELATLDLGGWMSKVVDGLKPQNVSVTVELGLCFCSRLPGKIDNQTDR
jgi:hypothetical protein